MKSKVFLLLLVFILWSAASAWYYITVVKARPENAKTTSKDINHTMGLHFEESSDFPILSDSFVEEKRAFLDGFTSLDTLVIVGFYISTEENLTSSIDLGVARANAASVLFSEVPEKQVVLYSASISKEEISKAFHCKVILKKANSVISIGGKVRSSIKKNGTINPQKEQINISFSKQQNYV